MTARALGAEVREAAAVMCDLSVLLGSEPVSGLTFQSHWKGPKWVAFVTVCVPGQADAVLRLLESVGGRLTAYDDDFSDGRTRWIVQWRGVDVHVVGALRPAAPRPTSGLSFAYYTVTA